MKQFSVTLLCLLVAGMATLFIGARLAEAVTCNPLELSPCAGAFSSSTRPSAACCSKLKEQQPCLCGYIRNPAFSQYVNSPGARAVASACGVFPFQDARGWAVWELKLE